MARPPRFRISAVADLLEQLRYAPADTRRRQMDAAEALSADIDPDQNYPEGFVIFRITSFRPETGGDAVFVGSALLADLATFIERLSDSLILSTEDCAPRNALTRDDVCQHLRVSPTTLFRYRKQGLVAHHVVGADGRKRLCYFKDAVERFVAQRSELVARAGRFSRIEEETAQRIIVRARRYHESAGLSLNETAVRLSRRFKRSVEAIRQRLQHYDRDHPHNPIFAEMGPLTERQRAAVLRAHRRGIPTRTLAQHYGRNRNTIYRAINDRRAERLREWELAVIELPTFALEEAEAVILSGDSVTTGFDPHLSLGGDAQSWVKRARATAAPEPELDVAWVGGMNYLKFAARRLIEQLDRRVPKARELDQIETWLRWATRLKQRVLTAHQGAVLKTLEIHVGRKLLECSGGEIRDLHQLAQTTASLAVDEFDPARGLGFEPFVTFRLRQTLAQHGEPSASPRAARARRIAGSLPLPDSASAVSPWQRDLELPLRISRILDRIEGKDGRFVLTARYGLAEQAPQTCAGVGERCGKTAEQVAAIEQRSIRALLRILHRDNADAS